MAAVQSRARKSVNRGDMPDPVYWVWKKLTSVRVAIMMILIVAFMAFLSVLIPQVPPQFTGSIERIQEHVELQRGTWGPFTDVLANFPWFYDARGGIFNLYNQPYWYALVAVLALAVTTCTISRFPPIWRTVSRPRKRVNDAYFERARYRLDFTTPAEPALIEAAFRRRGYGVTKEERDGATYLFADRFSWAMLGTFLSHAGLIALIVGTLITKVGAEEIQFWLGESESHPLFATAGDRQQIQVIVDDASASFTNDGQALDFRSAVRVTSGGEEIAAGEVTVNGPITFNGWRLHQAAYYENGAALQVRDVRDGQLVYSETLMLDEQLFGPRITIRAAASGELITDEVVPPAFLIPDLPDSGYQLVPLAPDVSLALILITTEESVEFHYAVVSLAGGVDATALDSAALHIGQAQPIAPRVRLYALGAAEPFSDTVVPIVPRDDLPGARIGLIPLADSASVSVGYAEDASGDRFFYFLSGADVQGFLAPGERVRLGDVELEYVAPDVDGSQWGSLSAGASQRIGAVDLTYGGSESVFFRTEPNVPGAEGEALILVERFGQGGTAGTFEARGGENIAVTREGGGIDPAYADRPARLGVGLGGGTPRFNLNAGESAVVGDFEYLFLGPREFTGLTVRRDPGSNVFWGAIIAGIVGLVIVLLVPRRRVWAKITPERTYLAGLAGHGTNLTREFGGVARSLGAPDAPEAVEDDEE